MFISVAPVSGFAKHNHCLVRSPAAPQHSLRGRPELLRETPEMSVHEAPTAGPNARLLPPDFWARHRRGFIIATLAAPIMAILGALGTDDIPFLPRLFYWLLLMLSGALIGFGVSTGVHVWGRLSARPVLEGTLIAFAIAVPLTLIVSAASGMFFGNPIPSAIELLIMFGLVFMISGMITALNYAVNMRASTVAGDPERAKPITEEVLATEPEAIASRARLLDRLPAQHRAGPVFALQAEDHYLRVHTSAGSTLILMRLTDAISELDGADGAQTHRSWWVARAAIERIERGEGRATLHLNGEIEAPVSRTYYRILREAGWF
jgi:hypothetical protein